MRIRGLCDYPSMALNDGEMENPKDYRVKLQQHFTFKGIKTNNKAKSEYQYRKRKILMLHYFTIGHKVGVDNQTC